MERTKGGTKEKSWQRELIERKKRGNKKWIEAQMVKYPTPFRASDALIGDEEQTRIWKK